MANPFLNHLPPELLETFLSLTTPFKIQQYLDSLPYVGEELNRSPLRVLQDRKCHCLDGGLLAASALRNIGYPPLLVDLQPEPNTDDDHILALFKQYGLYGAIAKSNYVGLRFREPVYRTVRELVMSYFNDFYSLQHDKTLRFYTRPINMIPYDRYGWEWSLEGVECVVQRIYSSKLLPVIGPQTIAILSPVDQRFFEAGMMGTNFDGLFKPKPK